MIDADNQLGITGQKALCFLSTSVCARFIWRDTGSNVPGGSKGVQKWMKAIIGLWGPRVGVCSLEGWEMSLKAALVEIPYGKVFGRCRLCSSGTLLCVGYGSQGRCNLTPAQAQRHHQELAISFTTTQVEFPVWGWNPCSSNMRSWLCLLWMAVLITSLLWKKKKNHHDQSS